MNEDFWVYLQKLVDSSKIILDRPKGSLHPRFGHIPYPVSYGFLEGTHAIDAGGVDIWVGSTGEKQVVGALCTVDLHRRDTELKILYDCNDEEIKLIMQFINSGEMRGYYLERETE